MDPLPTVETGAVTNPTSGFSGQTTMLDGVGSVNGIGGAGNVGGLGAGMPGSGAGAAGGANQFNQMLSNGANTDMLFASIGKTVNSSNVTKKMYHFK